MNVYLDENTQYYLVGSANNQKYYSFVNRHINGDISFVGRLMYFTEDQIIEAAVNHPMYTTTGFTYYEEAEQHKEDFSKGCFSVCDIKIIKVVVNYKLTISEEK